MEDHTAEAIKMGLQAFHLPSPADVNITDADILFASPEFWTNPEGSKLLQKMADRIVAVVTDEVHVVPKWLVHSHLLYLLHCRP